MRINFILFIFIYCFSISVFAQRKTISTKSAITAIFSFYDNGEYKKALKGLDKIQDNVIQHAKNRKDIQGLIFYWKGLCLIKLNEYEQAEGFLKQAIDIKFESKDLYYEYGQALYALDKLKPARVAFKKSVKNNYKRGVSLYYIAYISQQLEDLKKAVSFYNAIEKLPDEEKADVIQAARMQVGDIYLKQVEKMPDSFRSVEKYVIPQYEKALNWDEDTKLAEEIKKKIIAVQKRYDLLLFKMRNGVQTAIPRHFLKFYALYGSDDNVTDSDESSKSSLEVKDYASSYYNSGFYGRYSFYPNSTYSIAPVISLDYTKYLSDSDYIKPYNLLTASGGLQLNYEHTLKNNPATFYLNLDYIQNQDDSDLDDKLENTSTSTSIQLSELLQFWTGNPSTFRFKYAQTKAEDEALSFNTTSFVWEQLVNRGALTLYFFTSFDMNRYTQSQTSDTNIATIRGDWIWPTIFGLINPNLFASARLTNYIEDEARGTTNLIQYGASLNRPIGSKWFVTLDYIRETQTGNEDTDVHEGSRYSFKFDYFY